MLWGFVTKQLWFYIYIVILIYSHALDTVPVEPAGSLEVVDDADRRAREVAAEFVGGAVAR